jgi:hypothetical protein
MPSARRHETGAEHRPAALTGSSWLTVASVSWAMTFF